MVAKYIGTAATSSFFTASSSGPAAYRCPVARTGASRTRAAWPDLFNTGPNRPIG